MKYPIHNIAKEELEKNRAVFESLKDYDEGKKDISIVNVREHMTPTYTRYGDHNRKNRELLEETHRIGGNPYYCYTCKDVKDVCGCGRM